MCCVYGRVCDVWHGRPATDLWNTIDGGPHRDRSVPPRWLIGYRSSGRGPKVCRTCICRAQSYPVGQARISALLLRGRVSGEVKVGGSPSTRSRCRIIRRRRRFENVTFANSLNPARICRVEQSPRTYIIIIYVRQALRVFTELYCRPDDGYVILYYYWFRVRFVIIFLVDRAPIYAPNMSRYYTHDVVGETMLAFITYLWVLCFFVFFSFFFFNRTFR